MVVRSCCVGLKQLRVTPLCCTPVSRCCFPLLFLFPSRGPIEPLSLASLSVFRPLPPFPPLDSPIHNYRVYHSRLRNLHYRAASRATGGARNPATRLLRNQSHSRGISSLTGRTRRASNVIVPIPIVLANRISGCFSRLLFVDVISRDRVARAAPGISAAGKIIRRKFRRISRLNSRDVLKFIQPLLTHTRLNISSIKSSEKLRDK